MQSNVKPNLKNCYNVKNHTPFNNVRDTTEYLLLKCNATTRAAAHTVAPIGIAKPGPIPLM